MIIAEDLPTYDVKLPSNGKTIKVRPFVVKEEKLLLIALQSGDENEIINTTCQVINNCIIEGDVKAENLPFFDVDYLFITLRAKSVGETITLDFTCKNLTENGACNTDFPVVLDMLKYKLLIDETLSKDIFFNDKVAVRMKYPTYGTMKRVLDNEEILDKALHVIVGSIDFIKSGESIKSSKDMSKTEIQEFVESLRQEQYKKLENYINNFPKFVLTAEGTCKKCGKKHKVEYTDFLRFFE